MKLKKYQDYSIIYFSLHGESNKIKLSDEDISLDELAELANGAFKDKIVHFSSCETIKISKRQQNNFLYQTSTLLMSGYKEEVDFVESAALELIYFDKCQDYKMSNSLEDYMKKHFKGLIKKTGFFMVHS